MRPVFVPAELRVHPAPQRSHLKRQLERRLEQVVETCVLALAKCRPVWGAVDLPLRATPQAKRPMWRNNC